jgi:hypothetical protein
MTRLMIYLDDNKKYDSNRVASSIGKGSLDTRIKYSLEEHKRVGTKPTGPRQRGQTKLG